jgi:hypothetical protein
MEGEIGQVNLRQNEDEREQKQFEKKERPPPPFHRNLTRGKNICFRAPCQ